MYSARGIWQRVRAVVPRGRTAPIAEPSDLDARLCRRACWLHGAELLEHEQVMAVTLAGGQVTGVKSARRSRTTNVVVDAARRLPPAGGGAGRSDRRGRAGPCTSCSWPKKPPARLKPIVGRRCRRLPPTSSGRADARRLQARPAAVRCLGAASRCPPRPLAVCSGSSRAWPGGEVRAGCAAVAEDVEGGMLTMSPDGRFVLGPVRDGGRLWVATAATDQDSLLRHGPGRGARWLDHWYVR